MDPDISSLKRPPVFGEGVVAKRPRTDGRQNPKSTGSKSAPFGDLFSGSDFRAKPVSAGGKRPQVRVHDPKDLFSAFQTTSTTSSSRSKASVASQAKSTLQGSNLLPFVPAAIEQRKEMMPLRSCFQPPLVCTEKPQSASTTPLTSHIRQLNLSTANSSIPARKVRPFHVLPVPVLESPAPESSSSGLRPLPSPNFDLGGRSKGKMKAMTTLEQPVFEMPEEEKEIQGGALELQRGLLVSPQKGGKARRFIRNGLAERAQRLLARSSTAFTLWQRELESHMSSRPGRLRPDLRLRVTRILHTARIENVHARAAGALRSILADCQTVDASVAQSAARTVLFSFAPESHDSHLMGPGVSIAEGVVVLVWRPWQELGPPRNQESASTPQRTTDAPTLLCSRFLVLPDAS